MALCEAISLAISMEGFVAHYFPSNLNMEVNSRSKGNREVSLTRRALYVIPTDPR